MRRFLACYNLVKNSILQNPFTDQEITPQFHLSFESQRQKSSQREDITSPTASIFGPWTYYEMFWPFCTMTYIISTAFLSVLKSSKKDKNMMSCTRLYVDPTETLTGQGRKRILARNGQSSRYPSLDFVLLNYCSPLSLINSHVPD